METTRRPVRFHKMAVSGPGRTPARPPPPRHNPAVHAEQAYLFRHAILRDAAYALQPPSERSNLHAFAGEILSREPDAGTALAAEIADHAREAHDSGRELRFLILAADHAASVYELDLEAQLCRRASASAACSPRQSAELEYRAGGVLISRGRLAEAGPALDRAIAAAQSCGDEGLEVSARLRQCELWARTTRKAEAMQAIPALVERARGLHDPRLLVAAELALDDLHAHRGEFEHCAQALRRALDTARELQDVAMQAKVTSALAYRLHRNGHTAEGESLARAALGLKTDDVIARATLLNSIGVICVETSRLGEAEAAYRESLALCVQAGRRLTEAGLLGNLGNLEYYFRGNLDKAAVQYARARDVYLEAGDLESAARSARMAGSTEYASGRRAAAAAHFEAAIRLSDVVGIADNQLDSRRFLALCREETVPGHDAMPELLSVAERSIKIGYVRNAVLTLCEIARRLLAAGMPVAAARALALAGTGALKDSEIAAVGPQRLIGQALGLDDVPEPDRQRLARGMPAHDTPHHYVNLTLWPDLSRRLLLLHGADGAQHLRRFDPGVRDQCLATLEEIRQLAGRARNYHTAQTSLAEAQEAMAESAAAIQAGRPAMLFRGVRVVRMTPRCLAALGEQMRAESPQAFGSLADANPALAALLAGPAPHWADRDLPGGVLARLEAAMAGIRPMASGD